MLTFDSNIGLEVVPRSEIRSMTTNLNHQLVARKPFPEKGLHLFSTSSIPNIHGRDYLVRPQKLGNVKD